MYFKYHHNIMTLFMGVAIFSMAPPSFGESQLRNSINYDYRDAHTAFSLSLDLTPESRSIMADQIVRSGFAGELTKSQMDPNDTTAHQIQVRMEELKNISAGLVQALSRDIKFVSLEPPAITKITSITNMTAAASPQPELNLSFLTDRLQQIQTKLAEGKYEMGFYDLGKISSYVRQLEQKPLKDDAEQGIIKSYRSITDEFFDDGILKKSAAGVEVAFILPKQNDKGQMLRHMTNLCLINDNCNESHVLAELVLVETFISNKVTQVWAANKDYLTKVNAEYPDATRWMLIASDGVTKLKTTVNSTPENQRPELIRLFATAVADDHHVRDENIRADLLASINALLN